MSMILLCCEVEPQVEMLNQLLFSVKVYCYVVR